MQTLIDYVATGLGMLVVFLLLTAVWVLIASKAFVDRNARGTVVWAAQLLIGTSGVVLLLLVALLAIQGAARA